MKGSTFFWLGVSICFALLALGAYRQKRHLQNTFSKKGGTGSDGFINDSGRSVNTAEELRKGLVEMCNTELVASLLALAGAIFTIFE